MCFTWWIGVFFFKPHSSSTILYNLPSMLYYERGACVGQTCERHRAHPSLHSLCVWETQVPLRCSQTSVWSLTAKGEEQEPTDSSSLSATLPFGAIRSSSKRVSAAFLLSRAVWRICSRHLLVLFFPKFLSVTSKDGRWRTVAGIDPFKRANNYCGQPRCFLNRVSVEFFSQKERLKSPQCGAATATGR